MSCGQRNFAGQQKELAAIDGRVLPRVAAVLHEVKKVRKDAGDKIR